MNLDFSPEDLAFRDEVRTFVAERYPPELKGKAEEGREIGREDFLLWHRILAERGGWATPAWPVEYGGAGFTPVQRYLFSEELARADTVPVLPFGVNMVGPVIYTFGTPAQKARHLPPIRDGEVFWCQGYSEPGAGSDLASLKTRAVRDGDDYVVNGQKTWTTLAQHADWIFCLVRTDPDAKAQEGISFLLIDMKTPGITVRPIITLGGEHEVNEVWFEDVRVPVENRVYEENKGWTCAKFLLAHERTGIAGVARSKRGVEKLKGIASQEIVMGEPLSRDPIWVRKMAELEVDLLALEYTELRTLARESAGKDRDRESSLLKIKGTEIQQRITELAMEAVGPYAQPNFRSFGGNQPPVGPDHAHRAAPTYFNMRKTSIYGGSNEIQRNIIAKLVLGGSEVDFNFSEDQVLLRDSLAAYLTDRYDFDSRRKAAAEGPGWRPDVWTAFAEELGILGAPFPEELGGLGGGAEANMIVMEALGEHLVLEPYLESVVLAGGLLQRIGGATATELIGEIVSGEAIVALAYLGVHSRYDLDHVRTAAFREPDGWRLDGHKAVVTAAPWATHLLVTARTEGEVQAGGAESGTGGAGDTGVSLFLVKADGPGVVLRDYATMDGRRAAEVLLEDAPAELLGEEGGALPHLEAAVDAATAAACAEAVGLMRRMHRETVDYAKQRRQFGKAIGEFQVIQHRLVDMFMAVEQAVSLTYLATLSLDAEPEARARAVSAAKVRVGQSIREVGQGAVQIHGGIGMTDELALGWRFKRATAIEQLFGDTEHHLKRFERPSAPAADAAPAPE